VAAARARDQKRMLLEIAVMGKWHPQGAEVKFLSVGMQVDGATHDLPSRKRASVREAEEFRQSSADFCGFISSLFLKRQ